MPILFANLRTVIVCIFCVTTCVIEAQLFSNVSIKHTRVSLNFKLDLLGGFKHFCVESKLINGIAHLVLYRVFHKIKICTGITNVLVFFRSIPIALTSPVTDTILKQQAGFCSTNYSA